MGCGCSRPQAEYEVDIRARYSLDAAPHDDGLRALAAAARPGGAQRAAAHAGGRSEHAHRQHHHHHHYQRSGDAAAAPALPGLALSRSRKQAAPPHHSAGSAATLRQLQQLLPAAPLGPPLGLQLPLPHELLAPAAAPVAGGRLAQRALFLQARSGAGLHELPLESGPDAAGFGRHDGGALQQLHAAHGFGRGGSAPLPAGLPPHAQHRQHHGHSHAPPPDALSPEEVLALCGAVVEEEPALQRAGITPLLLASLCLIESGGCPSARQFREHLGDVAIGLCQVLLSTAQWLATSHGWDRYGPAPSARDLEQPRRCAYYCAAYLAHLAQHGGAPRSEAFVVRAFHAGPKGVHTAAARVYLQKFLKAKHCLSEAARAMAASLAAAAVAAGLPLPDPAELRPGAGTAGAPAPASQPEQPGGRAAAAHAKAAAGGGGGGRDQALRDQDGGGTGASSEQIRVPRLAAGLVAMLSSCWDDGGGAAAAQSSGSGFLAHVLPGLWGRQAAPQPAQPALGAGALGQHGRRFSGGSASSGGSADAPLGLVAVSRAATEAAWRRLACISPAIASTALATALAAAAAAAPPAAPRWRPGPGAGHSRSSSVASVASAGSGGGACAAAPAGWQPCVMHVVGHGETLEGVAAAAGVGALDLLAANPDLPAGEPLQAHDCIALPVPAVPPRLYVLRPGDSSLTAVARAHGVPLGRLLARNPELADPSRVQPGWVVLLPGLKGESRAGLPMEWLAEAAAALEEPAAVLDGPAPALEEPAASGGGGEQQGLASTQPPATSGGGGPFAAWQAAQLQQQQQQHHGGAGSAAFVSRQAAACAPGGPSPAAPSLPPCGSGAYVFAIEAAGSSSGGGARPPPPPTRLEWARLNKRASSGGSAISWTLAAPQRHD